MIGPARSSSKPHRSVNSASASSVLRPRAQCMRHGARGLGDDGGIPRIGPGLAGMQIGNAAHGQSRQISDLKAFCARYRDRQGAYRGGLIGDEQGRAVYSESGDQRSQLLFIIWQGLIRQPLSRSVQRHGMVRPFPHSTPIKISTPSQSSWSVIPTSRIAMTLTANDHGRKSRHPRTRRPHNTIRAEPLSAMTHCLHEPSGNTPGSWFRLGAAILAGRTGRTSVEAGTE